MLKRMFNPNYLVPQTNFSPYNPANYVGQSPFSSFSVGQNSSVNPNVGQAPAPNPNVNQAPSPNPNAGQTVTVVKPTNKTQLPATSAQVPPTGTKTPAQKGTYVQNPYVQNQYVQKPYVQKPYVPPNQVVIQPNLKPPLCQNRTNMHVLNTQRLLVDFSDSQTQSHFSVPRRYSFTRFGQPLLFAAQGGQNQQNSPNPYLYVGQTYKNMGGDTIYGSWNPTQYGGFYALNVTVPWYPNSLPTTQICRNISRAIEAMVYGDRYVIEGNPRLMQASIVVKYLTNNSNTDTVESWGNVRDFLY